MHNLVTLLGFAPLMLSNSVAGWRNTTPLNGAFLHACVYEKCRATPSKIGVISSVLTPFYIVKFC